MDMKLKLMLVKEASGEKMTNPVDIVKSMQVEAKADRECFWVLHLNNANKIIEKELVSMGSVNATIVFPREVFKKAIVNGATNIITVHNHPAGGLVPSEQDKKVWKRLDESGEILGIKAIDHLIIVPDGNYYSEKS